MFYQNRFLSPTFICLVIFEASSNKKRAKTISVILHFRCLLSFMQINSFSYPSLLPAQIEFIACRLCLKFYKFSEFHSLYLPKTYFISTWNSGFCPKHLFFYENETNRMLHGKISDKESGGEIDKNAKQSHTKHNLIRYLLVFFRLYMCTT